jgi:hypothetical protein
MEKIPAIIALGVLITLSGCGRSIDLSGEQLAEMQENSSNAQIECYEWLEAEALAAESAIGNLTKEQQFMFLILQNNTKIIAAATGKAVNPCNGETNIYDMVARIVESDNEKQKEIVDDILTGATIVGGILATGNLLEKIKGTELTINSGGDTDLENVANNPSNRQYQANNGPGGDNNSTCPDGNCDDKDPAFGECGEDGFIIGVPGCSCESREEGNC